MAHSRERAILLLRCHPTLATTVQSTIATVPENGRTREALAQARWLLGRIPAEVVRTASELRCEVDNEELKRSLAESEALNTTLRERMVRIRKLNTELNESLMTSKDDVARLKGGLAERESGSAVLKEKNAALEMRIAELERDDGEKVPAGDRVSAAGKEKKAKASPPSPASPPQKAPPRKTILSPVVSLAKRVFSPRATRTERKRREES